MRGALWSTNAPHTLTPDYYISRTFVALTYAYQQCILICMRTTVIIKDEILKKAAELSGIRQKTALIHAGLEALIEKKARERLAALGGSDPNATAGRRRR